MASWPFRTSEYWLREVAKKLVVKEGDLTMLADYWVVGLGSGHRTLHKFLDEPRDVTGDAYTIKSFTGLYKGVRISTIAIGGGPCYAEWIVALAHARRTRALIGLGFWGALSEELDIGDIVIPLAAARDEDLTDHYVDKRIPAIADYELIKLLEGRLKELGIVPRMGIVVTTSATFTESAKWAREWNRLGGIAVDCETSVVYILTRLCNIPSATVLVVSDSVTEGYGCSDDERLFRRVTMSYETALRASLDTIVKLRDKNA